MGFLPFVVENAIGHVERSEEGPDVVIRPVLESREKERRSSKVSRILDHIGSNAEPFFN